MTPAALVLLACPVLFVVGQEGRVVERHFASELVLRTESFELVGEEDGRSAQQELPTIEREEAYEIEIEDTQLDDGVPPGRFERFYRTVTSSMRMSGDRSPRELTASAGLEKKRVIFERDEHGGWSRSCADADVRRGQLNRLRADLSLACLLPPEDEDDEGASHTVDFAEFVRILAPLEQGARRTPRKTPRTRGGLNLAPAALAEPIAVLLSGAEGELTVSPRAREDDDELPRNATLAFRFEADFDGSAKLLAIEGGEAEDEVSLVYEGTGTLAWDPETGRIEVHCRGEVRVDERFTARLEGGGKQGEARGRLALTGTLELEASEDPGD